jgi:hypothetical protein
MERIKYTHQDSSGMKWRFEEGRPISQLADIIMKKILKKYNYNPKKTDKTKKPLL